MKNDYDKKEDYEDDALIVALVYCSNLLVWTSRFSENMTLPVFNVVKNKRKIGITMMTRKKIMRMML